MRLYDEVWIERFLILGGDERVVMGCGFQEKSSWAVKERSYLLQQIFFTVIGAISVCVVYGYVCCLSIYGI